MPVNNDERLWGDDYTLPSAKQIKTTPVDWLWPGRIAFNQLTIIEGDPGVGKSMLTAAIAAAVTGGPPLPGMPQLPPFTSIIANLEDDPAGITIPRLRAAGADLDRIYLPQMGDSHNARLLSLPDDLNRIWQMLEITDARLLVIDPLMAALSPDVNSDNDQQVRRVLNDLVQAANLRKAAVVIVRHLNKQAGRRAIYRGGGSIGIAAAARSVLLLSRDPAARGLLLSSTKQNLAAQPPTIALRIVHGEAGSHIEWEGERAVTSEDLLNPSAAPERPGAVEVASAWLAANLCDTELPARDVLAASDQAGIPEATLRRAARLVGVESSKQPGSRTSPWQWKLTGGICGLGDIPTEMEPDQDSGTR